MVIVQKKLAAKLAQLMSQTSACGRLVKIYPKPIIFYFAVETGFDFMIIVRLMGGLGNQLFQYATGRRLAEHHGTELLLDTSNYGVGGDVRPKGLAAFSRQLGLLRFRIKARIAQPEEIARLRDDYFRATTRDRVVRQIRRFWPGFLRNTNHIIERQYRFQPEALKWPDNVYLQGFWQSPKYFEDIASLIRQELHPTDAAISESAKVFVGDLKSRYSKVVSLHVRRGDLAHAFEVLGKKDEIYGAPVTMDYITRAMSQFDPDYCFLVFSDTPTDIAWCREHIRAKNIKFSTAESDSWDFAAMTLCDHHIIANSTFSWWAAWLDAKPDKRVVAPQQWSFSDAKFKMVPDDLVPTDWQMI